MNLASNVTRKNMTCMAPQLSALKPFVEDKKGNFSAAVRDCIDFAAYARQKCGSLERAKALLEKQTEYSELRPNDQLVLQVIRVIRKP